MCSTNARMHPTCKLLVTLVGQHVLWRCIMQVLFLALRMPLDGIVPQIMSLPPHMLETKPEDTLAAPGVASLETSKTIAETHAVMQHLCATRQHRRCVYRGWGALMRSSV